MLPKLWGMLLLGMTGMILASAPAGSPLLAEAEAAGKSPARLNSIARQVLRHKEHQLMRARWHHQRQIAHEKRQIAGIKRALHHTPKISAKLPRIGPKKK